VKLAAVMKPCFALPHRRRHLAWLLIVLTLAGCASVPPPTTELSAAQSALNRADGADASQYSPQALQQARTTLSRAQAATAAGEHDDARKLALAATADADVAWAESRAQRIQQDYRQRRQEVSGLRKRLQVDDGPMPEAAAEIGAATTSSGGEALRLERLDTDKRLQDYAAFERLQARQALAVMLEAKKRDQADAQYVATRRVAVAELAAQAEAMRRDLEQLDRERSDLMVESSRQDAERARQEAERLRIEAQIQAEEAQRLRAEAEAAAVARQQAEDLVIDVGGAEADRLKAARAREAELARQEAELLSEQDDGNAETDATEQQDTDREDDPAKSPR